MPPRRLSLLMAPAALAVVGALTMAWIISAAEIRVSPDSAAYIGAARSLLQGRGITIPYGARPAPERLGEPGKPLAAWPPLYPLLLAAGALTCADPFVAAKFLAVIFFAANAFLIWFIIYRISASPWLALFGEFLFLACSDMIMTHAWAVTESSFVFFVMLGLWLLDEHIRRSRIVPTPSGMKTWLFFLGAACALSLAFLDRYAGLGLIGGGGLALLLFARGRWLKRIAQLALFGLIACLPTALWLERNFNTAHTLTDRPIKVNEAPVSRLYEGIYTICSWIFPRRWPQEFTWAAVPCGILVLAIFVVITAWKRKRLMLPADAPRLPLVFIAAGGVYIAFLLLSLRFFEANLVFDERILAPFFIISLICVLCVPRWLWTQPPRKITLALAMLAALFIAVYYVARAHNWAMNYIKHGGGDYTFHGWRESELIAAVRHLPPDACIHTNAADAIYFLAGRRAWDLPSRDSVANPDSPNRSLRDGYVVYSFRVDRPYFTYKNDLRETFGLVETMRCDDGVIYRVVPR